MFKLQFNDIVFLPWVKGWAAEKIRDNYITMTAGEPSFWYSLTFSLSLALQVAAKFLRPCYCYCHFCMQFFLVKSMDFPAQIQLVTTKRKPQYSPGLQRCPWTHYVLLVNCEWSTANSISNPTLQRIYVDQELLAIPARAAIR